MGTNRKKATAAKRAQAQQSAFRQNPITAAFGLLSKLLKDLEMNHAAIIQNADIKVARRMKFFLAVDDSWLFEQRTEAGLVWLEAHYSKGQIMDLLAASKLFWTWWTNAWAGRDMELSTRLKVNNTGVMTICTGMGGTDFIHDTDEFRVCYLAGHSPAQLSIQLDPMVLGMILKAAKKN